MTSRKRSVRRKFVDTPMDGSTTIIYINTPRIKFTVLVPAALQKQMIKCINRRVLYFQEEIVEFQ